MSSLFWNKPATRTADAFKRQTDANVTARATMIKELVPAVVDTMIAATKAKVADGLLTPSDVFFIETILASDKFVRLFGKTQPSAAEMHTMLESAKVILEDPTKHGFTVRLMKALSSDYFGSITFDWSTPAPVSPAPVPETTAAPSQ
jgi:hypothetical protein